MHRFYLPHVACTTSYQPTQLRDMCEIINHWRQLDFRNNNLIHQLDIDCLDNVKQINLNFTGFINDINNLFGDNFQLHTGLIPVPYSGDIENARIYILMVNPGFHFNDYYSENYCDNYRQALINSLRQENLDNNYPFHYLNPEFCHTSGGHYWFKKFKDIIKKLKENLHGYSYEDTIQLVSKNICTLELFPYHSINFGLNQQIINDCPSINQVRHFVQTILNTHRNFSIECLRQPDNWHINENNDHRINILAPHIRQSASFNTTNDLGDNEILGNRIFNKLMEIANGHPGVN